MNPGRNSNGGNGGAEEDESCGGGEAQLSRGATAGGAGLTGSGPKNE